MKAAKVLGWTLMLSALNGIGAGSAQAIGLSGNWQQWSSWRGPVEVASSSRSINWGSSAPVSVPAPAPAPSTSYASAAPAWYSSPIASIGGAQAPTSEKVDAVINFGSGPYPMEGLLTTGAGQPWYQSPSVTQFFGGVPNSQQQADFMQTIIGHVESTYANSGLNVNVSADPNAITSHEMSIVSGTQFPANPNAVGITAVGYSGFSFIDKFASARSLDELEWVVAHNVAHELMHAFGADHHDTTGRYLDSGVTAWDVMADPNAQFSPSAVADLLNRDLNAPGEALQLVAHQHVKGSCPCSQSVGDYEVVGQTLGGAPLPSPVPEPAAWLAWLLLALAFPAASKPRRRIA